MIGQKSLWNTSFGAEKYLKDCVKGSHNRITVRLQNMLQKEVAGNKVLGNELIVDLGCGPANCAKVFVDEYHFKNILAVDVSEAMLDIVPWNLDLETVRVTFQRDDLNTCKLKASDESADLVVAIRIGEYIQHINHLIAESARVLKPGGYLGLTALLHPNGPDSYRIEDIGLPLDYFSQNLLKFTKLFKQKGFKTINRHIFTNDVLRASPENLHDAKLHLLLLQKR